VSPGRTSKTATRRTPRQDRARETVRAILQAAADSISSEGYAAASTNRIAARAGVSIGSLYQYFPDKQAILSRLLEEHRKTVRPLIEQSLKEFADPKIPFAITMRALFERLVEVHSRDPRLSRALSEEVPYPEEAREQQRIDNRRYTEEVARILRRRPDIHVHHPEAAAHVLVQATSALSRWAVHDAPETLDGEAVVNAAVQLLTAFVRPGAAGRASRRPRPPT